MPMADAMELFDYWNVFPPVHILMRTQFRFEPREASKGLASMIPATKVLNAPKADREIFEMLKLSSGAQGDGKARTAK